MVLAICWELGLKGAPEFLKKKNSYLEIYGGKQIYSLLSGLLYLRCFKDFPISVTVFGWKNEICSSYHIELVFLIY